MSDKDFVKLEQKICPVCGKKHSYDCGILIHKHFGNIKNPITGFALCEEHQKQAGDGYVFLIEIDPDRSIITDDTIKPGNEYRTGNIVSLKEEVANDMGIRTNNRIAFIEPAVTIQLQKLVNQSKE